MRIIFSINPNISGISLYWNDEELVVEPYNKIQKHYFCGKELLRFDGEKTLIYSILVVDLSECYYANVYSDGEILKKFQLNAAIDRPHKSGGQSASRFARIRENQITDYFKRIDEYLKQINEPFYLGISFVYKNRFLKTLHSYNKENICRIEKTEYANLSGIYQYISLLEKEK